MQSAAPWRREVAKPHQSPLIAFVRFQRTGPKTERSTRRVCFTPTTLLSFDLQGFEPPEEEDASPRPILPCCLALHSDRAYSFEGLNPPGSRSTRTQAPKHLHALLAFTPSEALPLAAVAPASRHLLSRAFSDPPNQTTATEATAERLSEPDRHLRVSPSGKRGLATKTKRPKPPTGPSGVCHLVALGEAEASTCAFRWPT
jgi:hypothetical protein